MSSCLVRRLNRDDAAAWAALRREALEGHPLAFGSSVPHPPGLLLTQFEERLGNPEDAAVFGAFEEGVMIGSVGVRRFEGAKERHKAFIWGMFVTSRARRRGAGEALLTQAIAQARSSPGVEQVHLSVSEVAVEAQALYVAHGFRPWGREPHALKWADQYVDEIHMVLDLRA